MQSSFWRFLAIAVCVAPLHGAPQQSLQAPSLGFAASFAVLGGSAVNNTGATVVTGNLGVTPGNNVSGFPPGIVTLGTTLRDDPIARQAHNDAMAVYNDLAHRGPCIQIASTILLPGVYCASSITGKVTLDAQGDANSVWI